MAVDFAGLVGAPTNAIFGQAALYIPATGSPYAVNVVFDEGFLNVILEDGSAPQTDARPVAGITDVQLLAAPVPEQDMLQITGGQTYLIKQAQADSHGITKLLLALTDPFEG